MMKTEITADEIVSLLHNEGYRAVCEPSDINLTIHSASQGLAWEIYVGVTDTTEASNYLIFSHTRFVNPVLFPVGRICNEFNTVSPHGTATFGMDDNELLLIDAQGTTLLARASKTALAQQLVAEIARRLPQEHC
jgi:hypothetical protein